MMSLRNHCHGEKTKDEIQHITLFACCCGFFKAKLLGYYK